MSVSRSWNPFSRRDRRNQSSKPYARRSTLKKDDSSWSLTGLLSFITGSSAAVNEPVVEAPSKSPSPAVEATEANTSTEDPPPSIIEIDGEDEVQEVRHTPRATPPRFMAPSEPTASPSAFFVMTPENSPLHPMDQLQAFLERKKQEGTPLNEIEYAGITSILKTAKEQTYDPEPFRFSSSPAKSVSPQPLFGSPSPACTPSRKSVFPNSTSLPTLTNNARTPSSSPSKILSRNPNGELRWTGGGSSRALSRRNSPARTRTGSPLKSDSTKRRRVGEEKDKSAFETSGSGFLSSRPAPVAFGSYTSTAGPSTPPKRIPRASVKPKTAPVVPSPLRQVFSGASPPGSPPQKRASPTSGALPQRTRAANVLTEIIEKVTPPPKPDIANPYETASPVKPMLKPRERKRMTDRRAKEKEKQIEKEREKEKGKHEEMPSPKAIIEATVPKGAKRSRPPPNIGKSPAKLGASESHLFGGPREEVHMNGEIDGDHDVPMVEEPEEEDVVASFSRKKSRSVTIEEVEDDEMADGTSYTKPSEIIEPSEPSSLLSPSVTVPSNATASSSLTSPTNIFGGGNAKSVFGAGKSSLPKEPSKLRSSFIAEEEDVESTSRTKNTPLPFSPPKVVPSNARATGSTFGASSSFAAPSQKSKEPLSKAPKDIVMEIAELNLPVYVFNFNAPPVRPSFADARAKAAAVPESSLPTFDLSKRPASTSAPISKTNGVFASPSTSTPKTFDWSAAGMKPSSQKSGDEWECSTCMLKNSAEATEKCAICEAPRPGAKVTPAKASSMPVPPKPMPPPAPDVKAFDWAAAGIKPQPKSSGESWTCSVCMLSNPASATDKCTVCESPRA